LLRHCARAKEEEKKKANENSAIGNKSDLELEMLLVN
jgi:hypothetical protein